MSETIAVDLTRCDYVVDQQRVVISATDLFVSDFVLFVVASRAACMPQLNGRLLIGVSDNIAQLTRVVDLSVRS